MTWWREGRFQAHVSQAYPLARGTDVSGDHEARKALGKVVVIL